MAQPAVDDPFLREAERHRRELFAHCYRMLGSIDDAEDVLQEVFLRAWRGQAGFERRASLRTWLYRIATNACLTALQHSSRRVLPAGLGGPSEDPDEAMRVTADDVAWLQPFPEAAATDPAEIVVSRTTLRLALIASLQYLPARQRAVLVLRDVLAFPATEVAAILDMSVAAVKSALQRARARLEEVAPIAEDVVEPDSPEAQAVLAGYMAAFENADAPALQELLRDDATLQVTGTRTWFAGKRTCAPYLARHVLLDAGEYRMFAVVANDQPAAVTYRRDATGGLAPFAIAVLGTAGAHLTAITVFADPALVARFGYPATPPA